MIAQLLCTYPGVMLLLNLESLSISSSNKRPCLQTFSTTEQPAHFWRQLSSWAMIHTHSLSSSKTVCHGLSENMNRKLEMVKLNLVGGYNFHILSYTLHSFHTQASAIKISCVKTFQNTDTASKIDPCLIIAALKVQSQTFRRLPHPATSVQNRPGI